MKIAFCFVTRDNLTQPQIWEQFFAAAPKQCYNIYCHPKYVGLVTDRILLDNMVKERVDNTHHGDVSLIETTLRMFAEAYRYDEDNQYFILLSESTIPLVTFATIINELSKFESKSIIFFSVPPVGSEHQQRLLTVENGDLFSSAFYFQDTWIVLHRRHVRPLLDRPFLQMFKRTFAPDEHYYLNVLNHLVGVSLNEFINRRLTFVNWKDHERKVRLDLRTGRMLSRTVHPKTYHALSDVDLARARRDHCWFFRKVAADCDCRSLLEAVSSEVKARPARLRGSRPATRRGRGG